MEYIIIGAVLILLFVVAFFRTPLGKGIWGEFQVKIVLGKNKKDEKYIINDLTIVVDGKSSQIDHLVIGKTGIFVIETKNYAGRIYGQESNKEWTQVLKYGKVKKFYNPILQNKTHIYRLVQIVGRKEAFISIIIFPKAHLMIDTMTVVGDIKSFKKKYKSMKLQILSVEEINRIYKLLMEHKVNPAISKEEHIVSINKMKNDIATNVCPRCGKNLVVKNGKFGTFYGCLGYPKCTFKKK